MTLTQVALSLQSIKKQGFCNSESRSGRCLRGLQDVVPRRFVLQGAILMMSLLAFATAGHCHISIMPMDIQLQASSAATRLSDDIEVMNTTSESLHVSSSVMDWTLTLSGHKQYFEAGTQPNSCAKWIQMNPVEFVLAPKQSIRVRYSISQPANLDAEHLGAEHWAMIFFTARKTPRAGQGIGLNVNTRIGCRVLLAPAQKTPPQCKILDMNLPVEAATADAVANAVANAVAAPVRTTSTGAVNGSLISASKGDEATLQTMAQATAQATPILVVPREPQTAIAQKLKITVENPGSSSIRIKAAVEARSLDGQVVATGNITAPPALVLAGAKRELTVRWDKPLSPGTYLIKAKLDYGARQLIGGELKATVAPTAPSAVQTASAAASAADVAAEGSATSGR